MIPGSIFKCKRSVELQRPPLESTMMVSVLQGLGVHNLERKGQPLTSETGGGTPDELRAVNLTENMAFPGNQKVGHIEIKLF